MINRFLLSLLMLTFAASDVFAYNADSGECMLMENIKEMLEEYGSYVSNVKDLSLQLKSYTDADGLIDSAKVTAESAKSSVKGVNDKAATKSKWAGGLSLVSTAANVASTGVLAGTLVNNKMTMKNLDNMHDTLNSVNAMDKEFTDKHFASIEDIDNLKNKAKCLKEFYDTHKLSTSFDRKAGENLFLIGDDENIDIGFLAYRSNEGKQQAYYCGEIGIKAMMFINMFNQDKPDSDYVSTTCRWNYVEDMKSQFGKGSQTIAIRGDDSDKFLKKAVDTINAKFDSMINGGVLKGTNRKTAEKVSNIVCDGHHMTFVPIDQ